LAVAGSVLMIAAEPGALGSTSRAQQGGTFRIAFSREEQLDHIDPALADQQASWSLLDAVCARLMTYPDKPPPAAFRVVPEVASARPRVSRDLKTYTFTLKSTFRFSDGSPVRADAFARAINRTLAPGVRSPGARYTKDIVGADDVLAGRASNAAGVIARGNQLVVRLKKPVADFPAWTTMPYFCAVQPGLPPDPEGVTTFQGAGPYYVAEYRPGQQLVLRRNRFYRGKRPHHVERFEVDLQVGSAQELFDRIERGQVDWGIAPPPNYFAADQRLVARYGVNKSQFFVKPGFTFRGFVLNTSRPLFRGNVRLRKAVNFALDRAAMVQNAGGAVAVRATDQYLPPSLTGFKDAQIYPLGRPNLKKAQSLAKGKTRTGEAKLYIYDIALTRPLGQILKQDLAAIGLDVDIQEIPVSAYESKVAAGAFDIAFRVIPSVDYYDPYPYLNLSFDSRFIGSTNWAAFNSPRYDRLLRRAALLRGQDRYRAYGKLDVQLAREEAPIAAVSYSKEPTLVSNRVAVKCMILRPALDITAACLK
jgi:peptide/nickel transport system substrate-binding protein